MDIQCICPPAAGGEPRHATDSVNLREKLDFRASLACQNAVYILYSEDPDATSADVLATLTESYVLYGVESWTVVGEDGKPVEPTKPAIRQYLLAKIDAALAVAEEADERYREAVVAPLVKKAQSSSDSSPIESSTSPISGSADTSQNHSSPSSISTSPMDDTAMTSLSPVGGSSSSQS